MSDPSQAQSSSTRSIWKVDSFHTSITFSAKHMMISTVRGRFLRFEGTVELDEAHPEQSSAEGTIEAASLTTDLGMRDDHLRSPDFFHAEQHPILHFRSTRVQKVDGNRYQVIGDLTIRGVTREVVFDVSDEGQARDPFGNTKWALETRTRLNRKEWGLNWNQALEAGGWLVGEDIKVEIDLELMPEAEWQRLLAMMQPAAASPSA